MTTAIKSTVNGIDVEALMETLGALQEQPALGAFKFRATNKWISGGHNRSRIKEFYGVGQEDNLRTATFVLDADEPAVLLGEDNGANPVEYVLHALAGCMTSTMVYHAASRGIRIEELESELEGEIDVRGFTGIDPSVRNGYQKIDVTFRVKTDAPAEQLEELARMSPVFDTISNPVPVSVRVEKK